MKPFDAKLEDLQQQTRAMRSLVIAVVHDGHLAEDVLQDTWLVALRQDEPPENPRGWLAGVAHNLALRMQRTQGRRRRYEEAAAQSIAPPEQQWPERSASLHALIHELELLEEPYREALTLRYLDGVPPREIAKRQNSSVATIKSRLHRGLKKLRQRLEDRNPNWALSVVGLSRPEGVTPGINPPPQPMPGSTSLTTGIALGTFIGVMTMKLASIILVPLLIAGLWWMASTSNDDSSHEVQGPSGQSAELNASSGSAASREPASNESPLEAIPFSERAQAPPKSAESLTADFISGSVIVRRQGATGPPTAVSTGELDVKAIMAGSNAGSAKKLRIPIEDGKYRWPKGAETLQLLSGIADGAVFQPDEPSKQRSSRDIKGTLVFPVSLRVVSADSGRELDNVEISGKPKWNRSALTSSRGGSKNSPVELPAPKIRRWKFTHTYWVRAPHHAWTQIDIDHSQTGDRTIALPLSSQLSLSLRGGKGRSLLLRVLYPKDGDYGVTRVAMKVESPGDHHYLDLPSGSWTLRIDDNGPTGRSLNLSKSLIWKRTVELLPGESLKVSAEIPDAKEKLSPAVLVAGTLEVPTSWSHDDAKLRISGPKPMSDGDTHSDSWRLSELKRSGPTTFEFSTEAFAAGELFFRVDAMHFIEGLDIASGGNSGVRLVVPPPGLVTVTLKDAATGETLSNGQVVYMVQPKGKFPPYMDFLPAKASGQSFSIRAMQGTLELSGEAEGYKMKSHTFELGSDPQDIVLELVPPTGLSFAVKENGRVLPYSQKWQLKLTGLDGGRTVASSLTDFKVDRPGRYRFTMVVPEGFVAYEPRVLDIREGEMVPLEIDLIRK